MNVKSVLAAVALAGALTAGFASTAAADCDNVDTEDFFVGSFSRRFSSGATWTFDVLSRKCEGLILQAVQYAPAGGSSQKVLAQAHIAQLHVPYLPGSPRFRDITKDSSGFGHTALVLDPAECPGSAPGGGSPL